MQKLYHSKNFSVLRLAKIKSTDWITDWLIIWNFEWQWIDIFSFKLKESGTSVLVFYLLSGYMINIALVLHRPSCDDVIWAQFRLKTKIYLMLWVFRSHGFGNVEINEGQLLLGVWGKTKGRTPSRRLIIQVSDTYSSKLSLIRHGTISSHYKLFPRGYVNHRLQYILMGIEPVRFCY